MIKAACLLVILATGTPAFFFQPTPSPGGFLPGQLARAASPGTVVSVKDFGAKGDGVTDDSPAIQQAIKEVPDGTTIFFPPGTYMLGKQLNVVRSNITLMGVGNESVLKHWPRTLHHMLMLGGGGGRAVQAKNITVTRLAFDGNNEQIDGGSKVGYPKGIYLCYSDKITITEVAFYNQRYEAISSGACGNKPNDNVIIQKVHVLSARRMGLHIGEGSHYLIDQVYVEDTPGQLRNPSDGSLRFNKNYPVYEAGVGLDIEVEGTIVDDVKVTNSIFDHAKVNRYASLGISITPGWGPVKNILIKDNVIQNHKSQAINIWAYNKTIDATNVTIERNFMGSQLYGWGLNASSSYTSDKTKGPDNVIIRNNVFNDFGSGQLGMRLANVQNMIVEGNTFEGNLGQCTFQLRGPATITIKNNKYRDDCFTDKPDATVTLIESGNVKLGPETPIDKTPPQVQINVANGRKFSAPATVTVTATDDLSGVGRIFFFVDGIPQGYADAASKSFAFDPTRYLNGPHTLEAMAVDKAAMLSTKTVVPIVVENPAPVVTITAPAKGSTVAGKFTVTATVSNALYPRIQFKVDGGPVGEPSFAPFSLALNTATWRSGKHTIVAVMTDMSGATAQSSIVVNVKAASTPLRR